MRSQLHVDRRYELQVPEVTRPPWPASQLPDRTSPAFFFGPRTLTYRKSVAWGVTLGILIATKPKKEIPINLGGNYPSTVHTCTYCRHFPRLWFSTWLRLYVYRAFGSRLCIAIPMSSQLLFHYIFRLSVLGMIYDQGRVCFSLLNTYLPTGCRRRAQLCGINTRLGRCKEDGK